MNDFKDLTGQMADAAMEPQAIQAKELVSPEQLDALLKRSDWKAWRQTIPFFGAIALAGYGLHHHWGTLWAIPLFLIQGVLLSYGYAAQHEFAHRTAFATRWLNEFWGHVIGFLTFFPYWTDRSNHLLHHRYTSIRGMDFELQKFRVEDRPFTIVSFLKFVLALGYSLRLLSSTIQHMFGRLSPFERRFLNPEDQIKIVVESWFYILGYASIAGLSIYYQSWIALQVWILPMIAMKWTHQIHVLSEHYGLGKVEDIVSNTRTVYTTPINRFLVWNMCYHTAHHRFANVPFYNLRQLDRLIRKDVQHGIKGYVPLIRQIGACAIQGRRFGYEGLM